MDRPDQFTLGTLLKAIVWFAAGLALLRLVGYEDNPSSLSWLFAIIAGGCFGAGVGILTRHPVPWTFIGALGMAALVFFTDVLTPVRE